MIHSTNAIKHVITKEIKTDRIICPDSQQDSPSEAGSFKGRFLKSSQETLARS
jgi:hypothetical protein